jgi:hypothetical protein
MPKETPTDWVARYKKDIKSQHGEDGIIAELFKRIGSSNKWVVEFGALNGTHHSNSWHLIMEEGWSGVLIEADTTYFEKLAEVYKDIPRAHCLNEFVEFEGRQSLDSLLARTPIPKDFDLLSVDIDGNDYHVWDSLTTYRPRAVIIEFNPTIPNDIIFIQPRDMSVQQGASSLAIQQLGEAKGYKLAAVVGVNAVFVLTELFQKLNLEEATLDEMYTDKQYFTRLFQLYDGTLVLDGYKELLWHHRPISDQDIQVLSKAQRVYPSGISASGGMRAFTFYVRKSPVYPFLIKIKRMLLR